MSWTSTTIQLAYVSLINESRISVWVTLIQSGAYGLTPHDLSVFDSILFSSFIVWIVIVGAPVANEIHNFDSARKTVWPHSLTQICLCHSQWKCDSWYLTIGIVTILWDWPICLCPSTLWPLSLHNSDAASNEEAAQSIPYDQSGFGAFSYSSKSATGTTGTSFMVISLNLPPLCSMADCKHRS